jgi:hypothetical protein
MNYLKYNKFLLFFLFLPGILFFMTGCHSPLNNYKQAEIDSISAKWVPDIREGICNISATRGKDGSVILHGETNIPQTKQEIIALFNKPGIFLIDSVLLLPDTVKNDKFMGLVSLSVINMRKQPAHSSELVSQAILGTPVLILKNENSWLLIQTPDKYIAWTEKSSVNPMNSAEMHIWKHSERLIFLQNSGWVYSSPDESGVVGDVVAGSILEKVGKSQGFSKVIFPDGREGYVKNELVMDFDTWKTLVRCTGESVCRIAQTFLGIPYLWGGTSSKGADCSGFVHSVYFMNGMILSRDASLQARHGIDVDISSGFGQLKKGDLLFFGSNENLRSRVTHVAIFIGDNEYINSSGRVMINSLDSTRNNFSNRKNSLLSVKRIVGIENDKGIVTVLKHEWY